MKVTINWRSRQDHQAYPDRVTVFEGAVNKDDVSAFLRSIYGNYQLVLVSVNYECTDGERQVEHDSRRKFPTLEEAAAFYKKRQEEQTPILSGPHTAPTPAFIVKRDPDIRHDAIQCGLDNPDQMN